MEKKIIGINTIKKRLKIALEKQGNYIDGIDTLIEITAGDIYVYYLALRDVEELKNSFVVETTREGNGKMSEHPAIKTMRNQSEMIRRKLRELRLTISTVEGVGDDDMEDLLKSVNDVELKD